MKMNQKMINHKKTHKKKEISNWNYPQHSRMTNKKKIKKMFPDLLENLFPQVRMKFKLWKSLKENLLEWLTNLQV